MYVLLAFYESCAPAQRISLPVHVTHRVQQHVFALASCVLPVQLPLIWDSSDSDLNTFIGSLTSGDKCTLSIKLVDRQIGPAEIRQYLAKLAQNVDFGDSLVHLGRFLPYATSSALAATIFEQSKEHTSVHTAIIPSSSEPQSEQQMKAMRDDERVLIGIDSHPFVRCWQTRLCMFSALATSSKHRTSSWIRQFSHIRMLALELICSLPGRRWLGSSLNHRHPQLISDLFHLTQQHHLLSHSPAICDDDLMMTALRCMSEMTSVRLWFHFGRGMRNRLTSLSLLSSPSSGIGFSTWAPSHPNYMEGVSRCVSGNRFVQLAMESCTPRNR